MQLATETTTIPLQQELRLPVTPQAAVNTPEPINQNYYLCDGKLVKWDGPTQKIYSPLKAPTSNAPVYLGEYPLTTKAEALAALDSACRAWNHGTGTWPTMNQAARIECVNKFIDGLKLEREKIVKMLVWEICKSQADAEKEFDRTIEYLKHTIVEMGYMKSDEEQAKQFGKTKVKIGRAPIGVTLCLGPSNYPFNETLTTVIPALLMGNPVIMKTAKYGILLCEPMLKLFQQHFPPGVVNTIYGDGREIVTPIMESGKIDVLSFIGSSGAAAKIIKGHPAPQRLHSLLGLGAKNPAVVLPDANLQHAAKECALGALTFNGQRCTAFKVLFVHESCADEFSRLVASEVEKLKRGMPWDKDVFITPLYETGRCEVMNDYVKDAVLKGAKIVNCGGGESVDNLYHPAVLYPATSDMKIYSEEQFGPVVPIVKYSDTAEVIKFLEESPFGQQAGIFGTNRKAMLDLALGIRNLTSRVNINTQCQRGPDFVPFGGRKDSALGTVSIRDALLMFSTEAVLAESAT